MLQSETLFPHPGSRAHVKPEGVTVRVIQRNANGTLKVFGRARDGSTIDRTVDLSDLVPLGAHTRADRAALAAMGAAAREAVAR